MRKTLVALTVAFLMVIPALSGRSLAGKIAAPKGTAEEKQNSVLDKLPEDTRKALEEEKAAKEAQKAEEAKMLEEARKAAEEAKKITVAKVNGKEINLFMLTRTMNRIAPKYIKGDEPVTPETTEKIKKEALDRLILEELSVQAAIKQGINLTPDAIGKVLQQVKENLGSEQAYKEYLNKNNLTEDVLKELIERSQRYELITAREIYGKVKVDEKLVQDEYEKEKGKYILPDNFVVDDVWFIKGKDEAARKKAGEMLETIKKSDNNPYKLVLDGTFIVRKISIKKEKYPEIYKAITDMKVDDLSGIIEEKDAFHIIKVIKKEPSRQATFEEAKPTIEPKFLVPAQEKRRKEWEKELWDNAKIEILTDKENKK